MNLSKLLARCLFLLGLFVATTTLAEDQATRVEGEKHFKAGLAYVDDPSGPKLEEAYREFHAAYALFPSYKILSNIGYCALHLERDAEAIDMYRQFLVKATTKEITPRQRKQMQSDIEMLSASLITVTLLTDPKEVAVIDERTSSKGRTVVNRYPGTNGRVDLGIHPGTHKITVKAEGYEPASWEFEAEPATKHAHEFKLSLVGAKKPIVSAEPPESAQREPPVPTTVPQKPTGRSTSPLVYVGLAATGAFAVTATVTGLMAKSKRDDLVDFNRDGLHPQQAQSARDSAKTYALITDISLAAALVSAGATAFLYFNSPTAKTDAQSSGAARAREPRATDFKWRISPSVDSRQAQLVLSGKF